MLNIEIFGSSHGPEIGCVIDGMPLGEKVDFDELNSFLKRRAPGYSPFSTPRREPDEPIFEEGIENGVITGRIRAVIKNTNVRRNDYGNLSFVPRPGHADYTAYVKFGGKLDMSGGGPFSGRLTAPYCIAGGIALQILKRRGITVSSEILSIHGVSGEKMYDEITKAAKNGDSVGGVAECRIEGVPAGIGGMYTDGLESIISREVFGIPAVKGIEFGAGFASAGLYGSENNDPFEVSDGNIITKTNNCGGILGGISDGMPIVFRAAIKPTPSIAAEQTSVDLKEMKNTKLKIHGRHDPCIVPRALPPIESAAAISILKVGEL